MKIFIIGRHELLLSTAQQLLKSGHEVVAVVTSYSRPEYQAHEVDFKIFAQSCNASFLLKSRIDDEVLELASSTNADIAISLNWVSVIGDAFISSFKFGVLNCHAGDLPRYRGNAAPNWAIIRGENEIAVSVHQMIPDELDCGDVYLKRRLVVRPNDTIAHITSLFNQIVPEMFEQVVRGLEHNNISVISQYEEGDLGFRCYPRLPQDGLIDWKQSAWDIHNLVRSLTKPYSGAYTYFRTNDNKLEKVYVWSTEIKSTKTDDVGVPGHIILNDKNSGISDVYTGNGILSLITISYGELGEHFSPGHKWKSIRSRLGLNIEDEIYRLSLQLK